MKEHLRINQLEDTIIAFIQRVYQRSIINIVSDPIDFHKIDCEGHEYALINYLLKYGLMDKIIEGIVFEAYNIDEELNTNRLKMLLKSYEFKNVQIHGKDIQFKLLNKYLYLPIYVKKF